MTVRSAQAHWEGSLVEGKGEVEFLNSTLGSVEVDWRNRSGEPEGKTSPEELIAAAHSTCYSMALSHALAGNGTPPASVDTRADVTFVPGEGITGIVLTVRAAVPGLSAEDFDRFAQEAKTGCPVSAALAGTKIELDAALV
ncbi:MAG: OsmC family peroxiredoxin [Propionibacteriaceae bacterium]|jgi:osmotically inducible protein OsmC|nr:OsmC family peroxiredoxin [Propionibacteriaceae bacterium]